MRKKLLAMGIAVCTMFAFVGCNDTDSSTPETTTQGVSDTNVTPNGTPIGEGEIELGEYKGLTVYSDDIAVTDEEVEEYVNSRLEQDAVTEYVEYGTVKENDSVKVSYKGTVEGQEYTGGTSEGKVIVATKGGFAVDGFAEALIGHSVGETLELDLQLSTSMSDGTLAGKDVHFSVKILSLVVTNYPELTDEYVASTYGAIDLTTVSQFYDYLRNDIYINKIYQKVWNKVVDSSNIVSVNKDSYEETYNICKENSELEIYNTYGVTLDEFLSQSGQTMDEWNQQVSSIVESYMKDELIINAIAEAENITVSDEEFEKKMFEYAKLYGFNTVEEFREMYGDSVTEDDFRYSVKAYKVQEFVSLSANIVEGSEPTEETTSAATN